MSQAHKPNQALHQSPASNTQASAKAASTQRPGLGMLLGLVGVAVFALSLPMNRVAAVELDPVFVALARLIVATLLAVLCVGVMRAPVPDKRHWPTLMLAATCVAFGFPILTSLAMASTTASAGAVIIGLLPLATVVASTVLGQQKPSGLFWALAVAGAAVVVTFAVLHTEGDTALVDLYLFLAVIVGGFGYAWGGIASRALGGWQTICWVVIIAAPVSVPLAAGWFWQMPPPSASASAWWAVVYLGVGSQLFGFFFFYGGMAIGGIARVSQVQLLQLFLTLAFAALFLGERVNHWFWLTAVAVVAIVAAARLAPVESR